MKFSYKITCGMGAIIALVFSIGGYVLINQNFQANLDMLKQQTSAQHQMERYSFLTAMDQIIKEADEAEDISVIAALRPLEHVTSQNDHVLCILDNSTQLYCGNEKKIQTTKLEKFPDTIDQTSLALHPDVQELILMTPVQIGTRTLSFLSVYDVSAVYEQRLSQLNSFLFLNIAICAFAWILVWVLANHLTKPIRKLTRTTKTILSGTYEVCEIHTKDEIGELADSFNQMSASLADKIHELEESSSQKDAFMASFTHEIKTPMTTIIGYSDLLRKSLCDERIKQEAYEYMFREGKRLEELSGSLLQLYMSDHSACAFKPVFIREKMEQLLCDMSIQFPELIYELEMEEIQVMASWQLLDVLMRNLIKNAILAQGNPIKIRAVPQTSLLHIQVKDHGCGIPKEHLNHIKEPFYRVDRSRTRASGGNGIGLALCEKIAQLHGTTLLYQSSEGIGTTVCFDLMLASKESL